MKLKIDLRTMMLQMRMALNPNEIEFFSNSIIKKIKALSQYQKAKVVGLYYPIKNEPDLRALKNNQKTFLLPKVVGDQLHYLPWQDNHLITSPLGVQEPLHGIDQSNLIDVMIIPALALDTHGNRLGFGKGYFDRFLMHKRPPLVIGVIYPFQLQESLPVKATDMKVDLVIVA